ncbi:MAG TPA: ATPase, partial [Eubacteriaceae bacterium]|nr:ATPase [Eubacteriaceae bacterium]
ESGVSPWAIFFRQFKSIVMALLTVAALISFFIGETVEAVAVLVVIVLTAILGFVMEYKAGKAIEALRKTIKPEAKVLRAGKVKEIKATHVVPGDIVLLEEGDRVSADGRLLRADNLSVNEAMLTGESDAVLKHTDAIESEEQLDIGARKNMVFMGTTITKGNGRFLVTATGDQTEMGKISEMLQGTEDETTPLEKRLEQAGRYLIVLTLIITAIVAFTGYITGRDLEEMIKTAVALAIAAVPEGLPAAATITLAIGMNRMVKKNALVKNLPAVETLGSSTVICTDKTGTLTENQMTLRFMRIGRREIAISNTGYEPVGEFKEEAEAIDPTSDQEIKTFLKGAYLCSDAVLTREENQWTVIGDPTEGALVVATKKAGLDETFQEKNGYIRKKVIPFDSDTKYMAVLVETPEKEFEIYAKGAPQVIWNMCGQKWEDGQTVELKEEDRERLEEENRRLAGKGYRVLGLARRTNALVEENPLEEQLKEKMVFLGFAAILDPPREDISSAIEEANHAGIRTMMLTGDQQETAMAIAREIGIESDEKKVIRGVELEKLSPDKRKKVLSENNVYAQVSPRHKLDIVQGLKEENEIIAMTGDGVNDAPALKKADIGIAMGIRGTTVAKEASDMVLLDDRFRTIVEAVRQGRVIFDNIQKFIHYLLSCNLSEIIFVFLAIVLGMPAPLVALQILWLNVATGVFPALAMAWETPEEGIMEKPPRDPKAPIITNRYKALIGFQGFVLALGPLATYLWTSSEGFAIEQARTVGFMTLAMVHLMQVLNVRRSSGIGIDRTILKNRPLWMALAITFLLQIFAVYTPFMQTVLKTASLSFDMWYRVLIGSIVPIVVLQVLALMGVGRHEKTK